MKAVAASIKEMLAPVYIRMTSVEDVVKSLESSVNNVPDLLSEAVSKIEPIKGDQGEKGEPGKDGLPGVDGKSVTIDDIRPLIAEAITEIEPIKGDPGEKGQDGRDAVHLEILPAIDTEKQYPRGCYAKHDGGLWRSFEQTHGMRGWECIVEGVKAINVLFDGDRTFSVETETSSGQKSVTPVELPVMMYKKVWKEGEYRKGDMVTWSGGIWHCNEPTTEKPGDDKKSWTLAVKRGDKGKPASAPVEIKP